MRVNDVTVTAAQTKSKTQIIPYVCNVLHIKLVKVLSIWKSGSGSGWICHSKSGKIRLRPHWKTI